MIHNGPFLAAEFTMAAMMGLVGWFERLGGLLIPLGDALAWLGGVWRARRRWFPGRLSSFPGCFSLLAGFIASLPGADRMFLACAVWCGVLIEMITPRCGVFPSSGPRFGPRSATLSRGGPGSKCLEHITQTFGPGAGPRKQAWEPSGPGSEPRNHLLASPGPGS